MKKFPWIVAGVGAGVAAYLLVDRLAPGYADVGSDIENASGRMSLWGWKSRLKGKGTRLVGSLKEGAGYVLKNDELVAEGLGDKALGSVEGAAGHVSQAAGEALHVMVR